MMIIYLLLMATNYCNISDQVNRKQCKLMEIKAPKIQQEIKEEKTFIHDEFSINYVNKSEVIHHQQLPNNEGVKINNYLCHQQNGKLYKLIEIMYDGKIIKIQDEIAVKMNEQTKSSLKNSNGLQYPEINANVSEKISIFKKKIKNHKNQKQDKKNIVKNIIKIFYSWIQKKSQKSSIYSDALDQLNRLLTIQRFNNRLIKRLIDNQKIKKIFLSFLVNDAQEQILYSRIQDKTCHCQAIKLYISLCSQNNTSTSESGQSEKTSKHDLKIRSRKSTTFEQIEAN